MPHAQAREPLVPIAGELRFEAIYHGVIAAMGVAVLVVRYRPDPVEAGAALLIAIAATGLAFALSVGRRVPRGRLEPMPRSWTVATGRALREGSQRMMPLPMLLALLVVAAGRQTAGVAAACLCGWALASLAGWVHVRRRERESGGRAVHDGDGRCFAASG